MIRKLTGSALTATTVLNIPYNRKWRLLGAVISLVSDATAGTRSAYLIPYIGGSGVGANAWISISTSTVSVTTSGYCQIGNQTAQNTNLPSPPELSEYDELQIDVTLIAGDTYSYWLIVDEVNA